MFLDAFFFVCLQRFVFLLGCVFVLLVLLVLLVFLVLLVRAKSFRKKKNEEFKTDRITSFTLLLKLILPQA